MPVARRMARTSISGAMSGAASGFAAICRAISASVVVWSLRQSVAANALRAASLIVFAIAPCLALVRLAQRDDPSLTIPVHIDARKKPIVDTAERDQTRLAIVEAIVRNRHVPPRKENLA